MSSEDARVWLRANGYDDVADMIDQIMDEWTTAGKKTRRNWWDILAGDKNGNSRRVAGREFPVLRVAQRRLGRKPTDNALARAPRERAPKKTESARWAGHQKKS